VKALGKAASSLRATLGESLASIQKFDVPIEATTPSLEALKTFSMGVVNQEQKGDAEAIPFLRRAIELDPNFAMAYARLGVSYANLGQPSLASQSLEKAYELRDRVSEREKFHITADYYRNVTGEYEKEAQTYELWIQSYTRDASPHINLGANAFSFGQIEKAIKETQVALNLDPNNIAAYGNLNRGLSCSQPARQRQGYIGQGTGTETRRWLPPSHDVLSSLSARRFDTDGATGSVERG
jgi:eukaryotic-like serine/threonine-protein kinase